MGGYCCSPVGPEHVRFSSSWCLSQPAVSLDCLRAALVSHGHQVCFRLTGVDVCSNPG